MQIRTANDSDQPAWDDYVLNHPSGLAYHQFAWKKAVHDAYGFGDCYLLAEEKGTIVGVFPLIDFRIPLVGSKLISLPYCDAGGVLADNEEIAAALISHVETDRCQIRSTSELFPEWANQTDKVRMVLELPESSEVLLASFKAKLRSQVKKPIRDGLTAQLGGLELVSQFYGVFCENMRDLGSPVHSRKWIEAIVRNYGDRVRVGLVLTADGIPAAAGIILLAKDTVSIPWASSLLKYNNYNSNMLLYWNFLSFAADNGYRHFDFGRSTPGEGTYRFKEQWGSEPHPLYWYDLPTRSDSDQVVSAANSSEPSARRQFVTALWQRLPVAAANVLGPRLRRYISL